MRTWDRWQKRGQLEEPIDVADYEAIGTMEHALSIHAEEAFRESGADKNRQITERMFKALTDTFSMRGECGGQRRSVNSGQFARFLNQR